MISNDTFFSTGKGPEYMMRQFGVSVLKGEDLAYQLDGEFEAQAWYVWELYGDVDGPYDSAREAVRVVAGSDLEASLLAETVARTYAVAA